MRPYNFAYRPVSEVMAWVAWQRLNLLVYNDIYTSEQEQTVQNFQI